MAEVPPGRRSGAHRYLYDELVVSGRTKVIVQDSETNLIRPTVISIPVLSWYQYFNTGAKPLRIRAINTRLDLENLGLPLTHQGEIAD